MLPVCPKATTPTAIDPSSDCAVTSSPSCGRWCSSSLSAQNPILLVSTTSPMRRIDDSDGADTLATVLPGMRQDNTDRRQLALNDILDQPAVGNVQDGRLVRLLQHRRIAAA